MQQLTQLGFQAKDILYHIINAVILFLIVRQLIYKPVRKFMAARTERVAASLREAAEAQAKAGELKAEYERRIAAAEDNARARALEITSAANESAKSMTDTAKRESLALLDRARDMARQEHDQALAGLRDEVAELSIGIAEQILLREVNRADSARLAERYLLESGGGQE